MKKVVIVGAGPAGLTAAYELLKKNKNNYQVTILEQDKQVGGISKTVNYNGNHIDIGGHRFFTKEKKVKQIWQEILPIENKDNVSKNDKVMLIRNRVSRIYYENRFYDYPITINIKTISNLDFFRTINCAFSYFKYKIFKRRETNLEDFYINRFGKKLYSMFFLDYTTKVWGRTPQEISKEWGYQRVKGISIITVLKDYFCRLFKIKNKKKEVSLIDKFYYPKYGPGQFYEEMAKKIKAMGGKIITESKVVKINTNNNQITTVVYQKNNKTYTKKVDILISSMAVKDLVESLDYVDKNILKLASGLPYRDFITVGILVPKIDLKPKDGEKIISDNWLYIQDSRVKLGRIQIFNNWSSYMVKNSQETVWLGLEYFCNEDDELWNLSDQKMTELAVTELKKIGVIKNEKILDSCCLRIKKAYPAYFDSYKDFDKIKAYLNNFDNLYCIGRNGQHRYNNMDHSMMTAIKCCDNIIKGKKSKNNIWNVNIDTNYHEEEKS